MRGRSWSVIKNTLSIPFYLLTRLLPKRKGLWVFGAWMGQRYSDNPAALYQYLRSSHPEIEPVWISKNRALVREQSAAGLNMAYAWSVRGIWLQLRAEAAIFGHSTHADMFGACIDPGTLRVNLWHGTGIKKIGLDAGGEPRTGLMYRLTQLLYPFTLERQDVMVAGSETIAAIYESAFQMNRQNVPVLGDARVDTLLSMAKGYMAGNKQLDKLIYLPTFRNPVGSEFDIFGAFQGRVAELDAALGRAELSLAIRLHPVNHPSAELVSAVASCKHLFFEQRDDLHRALVEYGALITDFSSIMFDFALLDRPILFLVRDLADYLLQDRDLYTNFEEFSAGNRVEKWDEILDRLPDLGAAIRDGRGGCPATVRAYAGAMADGKNCQRIVEYMKDRLAGTRT